ncbi:hypothetical protein CIL03_15290 [Virgibacillus indicus]|uniref:SCP domain-containing protein n=1 Tax=Virgibacillus indicus TaxID=2024554 RepID=A0A265N6T8_9BACI|nr:CAP domain-containing protein [Virgibacillus indicus]OZU87728.1 hypothetical protein CIL03_15290 [Virgibacillus indicus]
MLKKIGIVTALSTALLFGGTATTADASANADNSNVQYKVYYSVNGEWGNFSQDNLNNALNKILKDYQIDWNKFNWENQAEQKEQPAAEKVKQPSKQEQAEQKTEAPAEKQPAQKEEPAKEQPVQKEEAPAKQQTEKQPAKQEAPVQQPAKEQTQSENQAQNSQLSQFEQEVVELTNQERAKHGLSELKVDTNLSKVAREKSSDMAANNYFAHNSPTYGSPFDMMKQFGVSYKTAGENIAKGQRTPAEVVNAWMNSEGHRANILNGDFTHIGVGYVEQGNHWTQQFIGK